MRDRISFARNESPWDLMRFFNVSMQLDRSSNIPFTFHLSHVDAPPQRITPDRRNTRDTKDQGLSPYPSLWAVTR